MSVSSFSPPLGTAACMAAKCASAHVVARSTQLQAQCILRYCDILAGLSSREFFAPHRSSWLNEPDMLNSLKEHPK